MVNFLCCLFFFATTPVWARCCYRASVSVRVRTCVCAYADVCLCVCVRVSVSLQHLHWTFTRSPLDSQTELRSECARSPACLASHRQVCRFKAGTTPWRHPRSNSSGGGRWQPERAMEERHDKHQLSNFVAVCGGRRFIEYRFVCFRQLKLLSFLCTYRYSSSVYVPRMLPLVRARLARGPWCDVCGMTLSDTHMLTNQPVCDR